MSDIISSIEIHAFRGTNDAHTMLLDPAKEDPRLSRFGHVGISIVHLSKEEEEEIWGFNPRLPKILDGDLLRRLVKREDFEAQISDDTNLFRKAQETRFSKYPKDNLHLDQNACLEIETQLKTDIAGSKLGRFGKRYSLPPSKRYSLPPSKPSSFIFSCASYLDSLFEGLNPCPSGELREYIDGEEYCTFVHKCR